MDPFHTKFCKESRGLVYLPIAETRLESLETLREPVFLWITPFETPRMISGSAAFSAAKAAFMSPEMMASSTLRIKPRIRVLREWLIRVRVAVVRTRFLAEAILGMACPVVLKRRRV